MTLTLVFNSVLLLCVLILLYRKVTMPQRYAAYTVFRGKKPGVYQTWEECQEQIGDNPKNKYIGYESFYDAQLAWANWEKKLAVKLGASTLLQQVAARPKMQPLPQERMNRPSARTFDLPPLTASPHYVKRNYPPSSSPVEEFTRPPLHNTPPSSPPLYPVLKRSVSYMNDSDDEFEGRKKDRAEEATYTPVPIFS
jgi:hypothetical protein